MASSGLDLSRFRVSVTTYTGRINNKITRGTLVRILVTGGAGFLGSHLCDLLVGRGDTVVCLDDLSSGRRANLEHLGSSPRFTFIEASVLDPINIDGQIRWCRSPR